MNVTKQLFKLQERVIKLSSLDISPKDFLNWKNNRLIDYTHDDILEDKARIVEVEMYRFNLIEALWLLMVKELKEVQVGLEIIKQVKSFMFEHPLEAALKEITEDDFNKTKDIIASKSEKSAFQLEDVSFLEVSENASQLQEDQNICLSRIGSMFFIMLLSNESPSIHLIKKPGSNDLDCFEFYPNLYFQHAKDKSNEFFSILCNKISNSSTVTIPLRPLLLKLYKNDPIYNKVENLDFYSRSEIAVLNLLKEEDFKKMVIHKNVQGNTLIVDSTIKKVARGEYAKELRSQFRVKNGERVEIVQRNDKHLNVNKTRKTTIDLGNP